MWFAGVDLGWAQGASGVAALRWDGKRLHLEDLQRLDAWPAILPWLATITGGAACYAGMDAPVIVNNPSGMREADRLAHRLFAKQHAGAYPVNLGLDFVPALLRFVDTWRQAGFSTALPERAQSPERRLFEVYPHAASVRLFALDRILPYKKGPLAARRAALADYRRLLSACLADRTPALSPVALPAIPTGGAALKAVEDQLDALLCAYVAAHFWYWGLARNNILGGADSGALVVPSF